MHKTPYGQRFGVGSSKSTHYFGLSKQGVPSPERNHGFQWIACHLEIENKRTSMCGGLYTKLFFLFRSFFSSFAMIPTVYDLRKYLQNDIKHDPTTLTYPHSVILKTEPHSPLSHTYPLSCRYNSAAYCNNVIEIRAQIPKLSARLTLAAISASIKAKPTTQTQPLTDNWMSPRRHSCLKLIMTVSKSCDYNR